MKDEREKSELAQMNEQLLVGKELTPHCNINTGPGFHDVVYQMTLSPTEPAESLLHGLLPLVCKYHLQR